MYVLTCPLPWILRGRSSLVVKVSDRGWLITSSSSVPLKTRRVRERYMLNLSRSQTSSRRCGSLEGGSSSGAVTSGLWNQGLVSRRACGCHSKRCSACYDERNLNQSRVYSDMFEQNGLACLIDLSALLQDESRSQSTVSSITKT
ncbi:hypothetical protein TNCV_2603891 [Trichonephila clavipes]|nr:hypothetical protein TNCV_2603891 [Trichonephila clavipes]